VTNQSETSAASKLDAASAVSANGSPARSAEDPDEQLGEIAQRALQHARRPGPEPVAELIDAAPHHGSEPRHREPRARESRHRAQVDIASQPRERDQRGHRTKQ
jgi:hypothetical protein